MASAALLCRLGADHGVSRERCLDGTGIDIAILLDPDAEITAAQELALIDNLLAAVPDPAGLGLEAGVRYHLPTYGIWGFALLSSRTARDAYTLGVHFLDLTYMCTTLRHRAADEEVLITFEDWDVSEPTRRFVLERDTAATLTIWREVVGRPIAFRSLDLSLPAPPDRERYEAVYGVVPAFGAQQTVARLDARLLFGQRRRGDPLAAQLCERQCHELLKRRRAHRSASSRVRAMLVGSGSTMPDQDEVAGALGVSVRTLRRQLAEEGTSFRRLVAETRVLLSEELLATGLLTVEQVAERVGYAEASSFVHAFRRWTGVSPGRWARSNDGARVNDAGQAGSSAIAPSEPARPRSPGIL